MNYSKTESPVTNTHDKLAELRAGYLERSRRHFDDRLSVCESPIEQLFLASFLSSGAQDMEDIWGCGWPDWVSRHIDVSSTTFALMGGPIVVPQATPAGLPYRVDFAFLHEEFDVRVAVEMDGHDFHERTKEQASRDKARERCLTEAGWIVVRFTGSDVYRDVDACRAEAIKIFYRSVRRHRGIDPSGPIGIIPATRAVPHHA